MDLGLNLTQEQKLVMTQQMQLSIKLLQMSSIELLEYVDKEVQENPVLEAQYNQEEEKKLQNRVDYKELVKYLEFDNYSHKSYDKDEEELSPFNFISDKKSLKDFLYEQISELNLSDELRRLCEFLIDNIDEKGYLDISLEAAAEVEGVGLSNIERAVDIVQTLEPDGIGARDIKECLKLQLRKRGVENADILKIVDHYLEYVAENKFGFIAKELGITPKEAQEYGDVIRSLEPKPSRGYFTGEEVKYIVPDAYIRKIDKEYIVIMNDNLLPRLSINNVYKEILNDNTDKAAVDYVKEKMDSAIFLIKSLDSRKTTIYRVLQRIVELQREYFDQGIKFLKPMTLKQIAEELELHESTISRAIRDKYIYTSHGTIKVRDLFTTGIASQDNNEDISNRSIKDKIKELIDSEDNTKPLSDQDICNILVNSGMNISRRTVAKYREEMEIKASSKRKRF